MAQDRLPARTLETPEDYRAEIVRLAETSGPRAAGALAAEGAKRFPESEKLQRLAAVLAPSQPRYVPRDPNAPVRDRQKELQLFWGLAEEHPGKWFAIFNDEVLALGDDARAVADEAHARRPGVAPFLVQAPDP